MKNKRFRYGTFSTAMMLFAVMLFVLVNLVADAFNRTLDLTNEQMFSLTVQSQNFLNDLDQDVNIYFIARTGHENPILQQLLVEYDNASARLNVAYRDPLINPGIIHQFAADAGREGGIPDNSIVVTGNGNIRVVTPGEMIAQNWQTGAVAFHFEPEITRAIHHVTQGAPPMIYFVTGSGERLPPASFVSLLMAENFAINTVDVVVEDIPDTADILFITMPSRDWTEVKAERILNFLQDEGRAFISLEYIVDATPNLDSVLAAYGLRIHPYEIREGDARNIFLGSPFMMLPSTFPHQITSDLRERNFPNLAPFPVAIDILDTRMLSTEITPLWSTSADAFGRPYGSDITAASMVAGDVAGAFNLAVAVTDTHFTDRQRTTEMVVMGGTDPFSEDVVRFIGAGNWQFAVNSLRWMQGQQPSIFIPPRHMPGAQPLMMTQMQANVIAGLSVIAIPLVLLGVGALIWIRRRNS